MVIIPEHLSQSIETEQRLNASAQLPAVTRLDQDLKQIIDSPSPEDQNVHSLDQLVQKYQGLTKQMKTESTIKSTHLWSFPNQILCLLQRHQAKQTTVHLQRCPANLDLSLKNAKKNACYSGDHKAGKNSSTDRNDAFYWTRGNGTPLVTGNS